MSNEFLQILMLTFRDNKAAFNQAVEKLGMVKRIAFMARMADLMRRANSQCRR